MGKESPWKSTKVGTSIEVLKESCQKQSPVVFTDKETGADISITIKSIVPVDRPGTIRHKIIGEVNVSRNEIEMYYTSPENIGLYCIKD